MAATEARIIWRAELDPEILTVDVVPVRLGSADRIDPKLLRRYLALVRDPDGREHVVLSDGLHRIRLDIEHGSLFADTPVTLHYHLIGTESAASKIRPLVGLLGLCRRGRFAATLFPAERRIERWIALLRVHDALRAGASQRDIAAELFHYRLDRVRDGGSDSVRSRVRRLIRDARRMAQGGYRNLLHDRERKGRAKRRADSERLGNLE